MKNKIKKLIESFLDNEMETDELVDNIDAICRASNTEMNINNYLAARRLTIESSLAAEILAGNTVKQQCEQTALAEISAMEQTFFKSAASEREISLSGCASSGACGYTGYPRMCYSTSPCEHKIALKAAINNGINLDSPRLPIGSGENKSLLGTQH
jgi:hypothetical protein